MTEGKKEEMKRHGVFVPCQSWCYLLGRRRQRADVLIHLTRAEKSDGMGWADSIEREQCHELMPNFPFSITTSERWAHWFCYQKCIVKVTEEYSSYVQYSWVCHVLVALAT